MAASRLGRFVFVRCYESIRKNFIIFESLLFEPVNEDRPAGVPGEDPAALVVAVCVVRQAHCAGELPDDGGEDALTPFSVMMSRLSRAMRSS